MILIWILGVIVSCKFNLSLSVALVAAQKNSLCISLDVFPDDMYIFYNFSISKYSSGHIIENTSLLYDDLPRWGYCLSR